MSETFVGAAKAFKQNPELIVDLPPVHIGQPDIQDTWLEARLLRPELYALTAVVAEEIVDYALDRRQILPPYGLSDDYGQSVEGIATFDDLHESLWLNLYSASRVVFLRNRQAGTPLYSRLSDVCAVFNYAGDSERYENSEVLLESGLGTATQQTVNALRAISRIVRNADPGADSRQIAEIARRSSVLVKKVAAVNIEHLPEAGQLVGVAGEDIDVVSNEDERPLHLKTKADGSQYVDFRSSIAVIQSPFLVGPVPLGTRETDYATLGCPATAKLSDTPAVLKLWDWAIDIAEQEDLFTGKDAYKMSGSIFAD